MIIKRKQDLLLILLIFGLLVGGQPASAQEGSSQYFADTGHWVQGAFFEYYQDVSNAEILFGSPITEEFIDPVNNRRVQYFQNVRLEFHAENPPGRQVVLTNLGEVLREPGVDVDIDPTTPGCHQSFGWSFPVCYSFLAFFDQYGREEVFGRPVSGIEYVQGRLVQYFEFAEFVWKPENPDGARVTLAPLGQTYFYTTHQDFSRLEPLRNNIYTLNISELTPRGFTGQAVVSRNANQTVYVTVQDQNEAAVIGALVTVVVEYPNGSTETLRTIATNNDGFAEISFNALSDHLGVTTLTIYAEFGNLVETHVTSFRIGY